MIFSWPFFGKEMFVRIKEIEYEINGATIGSVLRRI